MILKRLRRSLAGLFMCLAASGAVAAEPAPAPGPLSPAERAVILEALRDAEPPPAAASDQVLLAAVLRHAAVDAGQRVRPARIDHLWALQPPVRDLAAELAAARQGGTLRAWLASLAPVHPQYRALVAARGRYAALADQGGWAPLPAGRPFREGDKDPQVALLRTRLAVEGFGDGRAAQPDLFDAPLTRALAAFQLSHSLDGDGVLGPQTRLALNVSAGDRLDQIDANIERWRWLPHVLPAERVEVDTGGAEATLFRGGAPILQMKAVVGDRKHDTPMFASEIRSIVFNPPWNVPTSIAQAEILPKATRDPGYLARNHFSWVDGHLQQRPGPGSALGVVKFDLPSPFGVYLHDTPAKSGFARRDRALSHGCMRLEKPRELAIELLGRQRWTPDQVQQAIAAGATRRVDLETPVPLFVVHRTVVVGEGGAVIFHPDVYGWDRDLAAALAAAG